MGRPPALSCVRREAAGRKRCPPRPRAPDLDIGRDDVADPDPDDVARDELGSGDGLELAAAEHLAQRACRKPNEAEGVEGLACPGRQAGPLGQRVHLALGRQLGLEGGDGVARVLVFVVADGGIDEQQADDELSDHRAGHFFFFWEGGVRVTTFRGARPRRTACTGASRTIKSA